jgi:hypothetical protein
MNETAESARVEARGRAAERSVFAPLSVAALIAVMFVGTMILTPLYVVYQEAFGFSEITLTLIYSSYVIGNLVALLFFGQLSDQMGRRRVTFPVITVGILSTLVFLFAQNIAWLFVARMLSGFAIGLSTGTGAAWLAELYGSSERSRATLMATCANPADGGSRCHSRVSPTSRMCSIWAGESWSNRCVRTLSTCTGAAASSASKPSSVSTASWPRPRFQTIGRGSANPIAENTTEAGRQQNRRTDIKVILATS